ncbi:S9 family peptidase [Paraburkholderia nodosa]|uniref:S9 family peptidase n=1 Tax=Paraburkholderia nodosa TaxID=392320 RepID=UPI00084220AC|nr:S9 family peptidase [Paraburkholderia nodosa]
MQKIVTIFLLLISYCTLLSAADNQGERNHTPPFPLTPSDFQRALTVRYQYSDKIVNFVDTPPFWLSPETLAYRRTTHGERQFIKLNIKTGKKQPAFDHGRLAEALNKAASSNFRGNSLPFDRFEIGQDGNQLLFSIGSVQWSCDLSSYICTRISQGEILPFHNDFTPTAASDSRITIDSPDGKWKAYIKNSNVFLMSKDGSVNVPLSWDGTEANNYVFSSLKWSPDSNHLAGYRVALGQPRQIVLVNSSATNHQARYEPIEYAKAGDILPRPQPVLFDIVNKRMINIDNALFPNPFDLSKINWRKDGEGFTFEYNQRGHQLYRVIEVEAATGRTRSLIDEVSSTFVDYTDLINNQIDSGKYFRYNVNDGEEIIWASERDGFEHLYLFNGRTGVLKNQITKGDWIVRAVDHIDPVRREIWFEASGMNVGEDPYFVHAYRIGFDGKGLTSLTPEPANHHIEFSPDGSFYVDLWSRIDLPPRMALFRSSDNAKLMQIESTDISQLESNGWRAPINFVAKGRDGKTDIWGIIHLPNRFDPHLKYPVVEDIYAGPQGSRVPKSFTTTTEPLTQLGFIVVQIDGMGTNNRSRLFHDVAWKNLKDAGLPDRILWHKAAASLYPWYDISNLGIFGTSAGGQNAIDALLFHSDFYKVAVANSGCYDNRMDKIWWNEQWMGWPVGIEYSQSSAIDNADNLHGKLMLVVGEMDHNVDPASTFALADSLIKAGKEFEMVYVPGADHGAPGIFTERKLMDFFVRNVFGQDPPNWNAISTRFPSS